MDRLGRRWQTSGCQPIAGQTALHRPCGCDQEVRRRGRAGCGDAVGRACDDSSGGPRRGPAGRPDGRGRDQPRPAGAPGGRGATVPAHRAGRDTGPPGPRRRGGRRVRHGAGQRACRRCRRRRAAGGDAALGRGPGRVHPGREPGAGGAQRRRRPPARRGGRPAGHPDGGAGGRPGRGARPGRAGGGLPAGSAPYRSAARPARRWIATCAPAPATRTPSCHGCGSARRAG